MRRDDSAGFCLHKTLYSRWRHWREEGIFARMMVGLNAEYGEEKTLMVPLIDCCAINCWAAEATYLKAHRTATSMAAKKGGLAA